VTSTSQDISINMILLTIKIKLDLFSTLENIITCNKNRIDR